MSAERDDTWGPRVALAVLLVAIAAAFLPVFRNGFVYDDAQLIVHGLLIHDVRNLPLLFDRPSMAAFNIYAGGATPLDTFRPLTIASFMWDAAIAGKHPWSYHLTNLLLHLACVALVWAFARALLPERHRGFAILAAAWFGIAPLQSGAHVWISGRYDVLSTALTLSAILMWRAAVVATAPLRARSLYALVVLLFLLALLSKEVPLMTLPALALWPRKERHEARRSIASFLRRGLAVWPFAVSAIVYLGLRAHALGGMRTHRDQGQLMLALWHLPTLLLDGLVQAVVPSKIYLRILSEEYARLTRWELVLAAWALGVLALLALVASKRYPLPAWTLLWFMTVLAPACIVTTTHWPGFGRYLYLPSTALSVGLAFAVAEAWSSAPRLHRLLRFCGIGYVALLLFTLERYVSTYRTSETLYTNIIVERPNLAHGYGMLAASYSSRLEHLPEAAALYAMAEARSPWKLEYVRGRADTLYILGRRDEMLRVAQHAVQRMGPNAELHLIQARGLYPKDRAGALSHLRACLRLVPGEPRCMAALAEVEAAAP